VAKPEWGRKHRCDSCGTRFYDLMRQPAVCPKCGTVAAPAVSKPRRPAPKPKPVASGFKPVEIVVKDEGDGDVIENRSEDDIEDKEDAAEVLPADPGGASEAV
jgi:uncharacterized protein (TIGR02300 family)